MKTPDEIKNGLALCYEGVECTDCPYVVECFRDDREPFGVVMLDALAYIRQLEAERDFLLKYMRDSTFAFCDICKHGVDGSGVMGCKHIREHGVPCFEWRGVQKEE